MKKIFAILVLLALSMSVLVGCDISTEEDMTIPEGAMTVTKNPFFKAEIIEISGNTLIVKPLDEYSESRSSDKISLPNWFKEGSVKVGDVIGISHDGQILESYPAQLSKIFFMEYYDEDGCVTAVTQK